MDRIVIGSAPRTGSTWAFNAAKLLAAQIHGPENVSAMASLQEYVEVPAAIEIVKATILHEPWRPADKLVTCVRDLRDVFCSAVASQLMGLESYNRRGLCTGVFRRIEMIIVKPSIAWLKEAGHVIRFESLTINKVGELSRIAEYLFPEYEFSVRKLAGIAVVLEVLPEIYISDDFDVNYGYLPGPDGHHRHVGIGGYRRRLMFSEVQHLEEKYAGWFEQFGYPVGNDAVELGEQLYE